MAPEDKPAVPLPVPAPPVGAVSSARPFQPPLAFKITSSAAALMMRSLTWRARWLHAMSAILILAALAAIGGGIWLIYYAGDLAIQQRSADVDQTAREPEHGI